MSETEPTRIQAASRLAFHPDCGIWPCGKFAPEGAIEYVRADLYAALEADRDCLRNALEIAVGCAIHSGGTVCIGCADRVRAALEGDDDEQTVE